MNGYTRITRRGWIENGIGYIPLSQGLVAKVDPEDIERLEAVNWYAAWFRCTRSFYAVSTKLKPKRRIWMHREILGVDCNVDHRDHDTLNNLRDNLRLSSRSENAANRRMPQHNTSGFKGVSFEADRGTFRARIQVEGKMISLGRCATARDAYLLYCEAAKRLHGDFACLK